MVGEHLGERSQPIGSCRDVLNSEPRRVEFPHLQRGRRPGERSDLAQILLFIVTQPLLLDAGREAGFQQGKLEILGQKILCPQLDGLDHAVHFLVQRRDDDDRQVAGTGGGLEGLQHLEAIHLGHHDIEQHQVERGACEQGQRFGAAADRFHPIAEGFDGFPEFGPHQGGIVDDENTAGSAHWLAAG
jgi:hypothetical protein